LNPFHVSLPCAQREEQGKDFLTNPQMPEYVELGDDELDDVLHEVESHRRQQFEEALLEVF
jgi:hypothetical protein